MLYTNTCTKIIDLKNLSVTKCNNKMKTLNIFLNDIFPNLDTKEYVLKLLASIYYGKPSDKLHIFVGKGANGKTIFGKLISLTFGLSKSPDIRQLFFKTKHKHTTSSFNKLIIDNSVDKIHILEDYNYGLDEQKMSTILNSSSRKFSQILISNFLPSELSNIFFNESVAVVPFMTKFTDDIRDTTLSLQLPYWVDEFKDLLRKYASKYDSDGLHETEQMLEFKKT